VISELRRLLDRARSQSHVEAAIGGPSHRPRGERSRHGMDTPTLGEGIEVSAVLRSILTGRLEPGGRRPELMGAPPSMEAGSRAGGVPAPAGTAAEGAAAGSDATLASPETPFPTPGDPIGPTPAHPPAASVSSSASATSSSTILPGGAQLS